MKKLINGEKIKLKDIIIPDYMSNVSERKIKIKIDYAIKHGYFRDSIILDENNVLVDGYSTYVLSKEIGLKNAIIKRVGGKIGKKKK